MKNKCAVITGATSGIGAVYADRFARQGYDLIITGRRKEKIEYAAMIIRKEYKVHVDVILAELSKEDGIKKVLKVMKGKTVDVLVNNAGFGVQSFYQTAALPVMEQLAKVNVIAPMELIHAVLPGMIERDQGTIINVSSESVYMIVPKNAVYSASKSFIKTFTEGLYMDLMETGVKVMAVCPGLTHTDFHEKMGVDKKRQINRGPMKWMSPEEVVDSSLKDLKKGKVISIPGNETKMLTHFFNILPRKTYYKWLYDLSRKHFGRR